MKLGTKVKCSGYLKKVKTKHVESAYAENLSNEAMHMPYIEIEDEIYQPVKEVVKKEFEGIVVAKKCVNLYRCYEICDSGYQTYDGASICVSGCDYIDCYQVFFRMGGSRLVPIEMCEVTND